MHRMGTTFLLVKFLEKEIHAKKFVHGEIFARKLSEFKQAEVRHDWGLALAFSVVPAIGIVYGLALLRTARGTAE